MNNELAVISEQALSPQEVHEQIQLIQNVLKNEMQDGTHYGTIPGTDKPTLLKPGAEKLLLTFRLGVDYRHKVYYDGDHMTVEAKAILFHIATGNKVGTGAGMCSTKESKYAWRNGERVCPECGKTVRKSKTKPEYYCWEKTGGCSATYSLNDARITGQVLGKVPNPDIADTYNTVMKIADKRALVAATLNATAASDIFTQDLEETHVDTATGEITKAEPRPEPAKEVKAEAKPTPKKKLDPDVAEQIEQITELEKAIIKNLGRNGSVEGRNAWRLSGLKTIEIETCTLAALKKYHTAMLAYDLKVKEAAMKPQRANA